MTVIIDPQSYFPQPSQAAASDPTRGSVGGLELGKLAGWQRIKRSLRSSAHQRKRLPKKLHAFHRLRFPKRSMENGKSRSRVPTGCPNIQLSGYFQAMPPTISRWPPLSYRPSLFSILLFYLSDHVEKTCTGPRDPAVFDTEGDNSLLI